MTMAGTTLGKTELVVIMMAWRTGGWAGLYKGSTGFDACGYESSSLRAL